MGKCWHQFLGSIKQVTDSFLTRQIAALAQGAKQLEYEYGCDKRMESSTFISGSGTRGSVAWRAPSRPRIVGGDMAPLADEGVDR